MKVCHLKNGIKLVVERKPSKSVVIGVSVKVGSNDEQRTNMGISHFIEHMLFEGTLKRKNAHDIASEIERLGGEINAATGHDGTFYYVSIPSEYVSVGLDVLSDMIKNSVFDKKTIEKERKVIINEINMHKDELRLYRWDLFFDVLYQKHPVKNPIHGTIKTVSSIKREDLLNFYKKYYVANNMSIIIVGDVKDNIRKIVERYFGSIKKERIIRKCVKEPFLKNIKKVIKKRRTAQSYVILGYKAVNRKNKNSYALDIIGAILGRGQSGRLFDEIRAKRGLAYDVGVYYDVGKDYGFFSVYADTSKANASDVIKIFIDELNRLRNVEAREVDEAKRFLKGKIAMLSDNNKNLAEYIAYLENVGIKNMNEYIENIKRINADDIKKVVKRYFKNYALLIIE